MRHCYGLAHNFIAVPLDAFCGFVLGRYSPLWLDRFYYWTAENAHDAKEVRIRFVSEVTTAGAVKNTLVFKDGKLERVE